MKFLHTADWHLGKIVNDHSMLEDQRVVLHRLIDDIKDLDLKAFIVSGDLYDRSLPPREAVVLADEIFTRIYKELKIPILVISGNHDSGERIAFGSNFYDPSIHFQGLALKEPYITTIQGIQFVLVPFVDYPTLAKVYDNPEIKSLEDGFRVQQKEIEKRINPELPKVLLFHGYLSGSDLTESDSERPLSIGSAEYIDKKYFEFYDYVALGHLHRAQVVNQTNIRYSGSILKYSKSEALHQKQALIVSLKDNQVEVSPLYLRPERDLIVKRGYFEDLMKEHSQDYIYFELLDERYILEAMHRLQARYPNALAMEYPQLISNLMTTASLSREELKAMDTLELFEQFYESNLNKPLAEDDRTLLQSLIKETKREAL